MPVGNNSTVAKPCSRLRELGVVLPTRGSGSLETTSYNKPKKEYDESYQKTLRSWKASGLTISPGPS